MHIRNNVYVGILYTQIHSVYFNKYVSKYESMYTLFIHMNMLVYTLTYSRINNNTNTKIQMNKKKNL